MFHANGPTAEFSLRAQVLLCTVYIMYYQDGGEHSMTCFLCTFSWWLQQGEWKLIWPNMLAHISSCGFITKGYHRFPSALIVGTTVTLLSIHNLVYNLAGTTYSSEVVTTCSHTQTTWSTVAQRLRSFHFTEQFVLYSLAILLNSSLCRAQ